MAIRVRMGTRVQDPSHYLAAVEQVEEQARNGRVNPRWVRWVDLVLEAEGITEELL